MSVTGIHINGKPAYRQMLLDRFRSVLWFESVEELNLPLVISCLGAEFMQSKAKRERFLLDGDLILISDVNVLYGNLDIIDDLNDLLVPVSILGLIFAAWVLARLNQFLYVQ